MWMEELSACLQEVLELNAFLNAIESNRRKVRSHLPSITLYCIKKSIQF